MPFLEVTVQDTAWKKRVRRTLVTGPPNSGKTASLSTFFETDSPDERMAYLCFPNEGGASSLDLHDPRIKAWVFENEPDGKRVLSYPDIWKEIETLTMAILTGKYGAMTVFAGDGLYKLFELALAVVTNGVSTTTLEFEAKLYEDARKRVWKYLNMVQRSDIRNVVFTCWDGYEKDNPKDMSKTASAHLFPELPGKSAKMIMGEFGSALYAVKQGQSKGTEYKWQTTPMGSIWGCGIKVPIAISKDIPTFVEQDWRRGLLPHLRLEEPSSDQHKGG